MSASAVSALHKSERKGSFFKLIDSFAWEIGTLKKEMGKQTEPAEKEPSADTLLGLGEAVGGLFLQATPCAGIGAGLAGARDSGYDSLQRRLSILDRLVQTHAVWLQLGLSHQDAVRILQSQPMGTFVVRKSSKLQRKVISLRMDKDSAVPVTDFPVKESQYTFSLEGSGLSFADLFRLVAFCCISRDVLPFTLKLPEAIGSATTSADLEEVAKLGAGFWDNQLCHKRKKAATLSGVPAPDRPPSAQRAVSLAATPGRAFLRTRAPSELECCQSNGALCFINPLFIKVHQPHSDEQTSSVPSGSVKQSPRDEATGNNLETNNQGSDLHANSSSSTSSQTASAADLPSPPPRPPPPRFTSPCPEQALQPSSMPEKIPWTKEKPAERKRSSSLLSHLGSSLSISLSSSPPRKPTISSPISIPKSRSPISASRTPSQDSGTVSSSSDADRQAEGTGGEEHSGSGQRLSDMSTDSLDSLFSHSSVFFLPPLHDPSPPTEADFDLHLPLSRPPSHQPYVGEDEEEDDEEDDEDPDYGVSLESDQDQDQDLTLVPPGHRAKRHPSAGALVLQRALRGQLRKMSGVFNSLLTPEKRAIRRVVELSRDRGSYFGCLVQDYLSYMGEGSGSQAWQGYASGLELLQTVRQFITQMKSYLRQSSELEPPIESLIPEDQIDRVLEKSMHKCVLKPLKPVVSLALREFQVRSGAWQELKENLSLAKARQPQEMGVTDAVPPDPVAIEKIKHHFHTMGKLHSPEKKVSRLLRVCKLIYKIMEENSGRLYGADDFLPMLTYVLAQCDMPQLDNEILYMMELLDPSLLHGEGGYYLTSAYGAMSLIRNFQEEQAARVLSSETRDTLHQWHRRRTTRSAPSIDDFQNYLRVALQELDSGCTAKTLQVKPYATVEEVCQLCAYKFKVSDPESYGLFLVMEGVSQQLALDTHPQKIKAELHSRAQVAPFHFVFRRVDNRNKTLSPNNSAAFLRDLTVTSDLQANLNDLTVPSSHPIPGLGLSPALSLTLPPSHLNGNSIAV
ncbi:uncharacterized protein V6R79_023423 [Siganus canaliculatus]